MEVQLQMQDSKAHSYSIRTLWTGNQGEGTKTYTAYSRAHEVQGTGKSSPIVGSSDPQFRGDGTRYSPEELLVASLSACHMLWYLHLCADAQIVVTAYSDEASGAMIEADDGSGYFESVTLSPEVTIADPSRVQEANELHAKAHEYCFIANSVRFPVLCKAQIRVS